MKKIDEIIYKIAILVFFCIFIIIRFHYSNKYLTEGEEMLNPYPMIVKIMAALASVSIIGFAMIYVFTDFLFDFKMNLPDEIRICGIIGYLNVDLGMWWVLHELGVNFSQISDDRKIISNGPYKYIRHPMYVVFIGWGIVTALIASNWLVAIGVPFIIFFILLRTPIEEQVLLKEFGNDYSQYMKNTGRFIPKIRRKDRKKLLVKL